MIITREMVDLAIELVRPAAERIIATPGANWGPQWAEGAFTAPGLQGQVVRFRYGTKTDWDPAWGEEKPFGAIAEKKLWLALEHGLPTSIIVLIYPWLLNEGDWLYSGGYAEMEIGCGLSGIKGHGDEGIGALVVKTVMMLSRLEAQHRLATDRPQI